MTDVLKLILSILICQLAGVVGALFNIKAIPKWYKTLKRSRLNPPNKVFGPVWTALYLLMGISLYLVWSAGYSLLSLPLIVFGVQLILNILWSAIFFGAKRPGLAFIEIILLWLAILATIIVFHTISHLAAYLLIPYLLWVSFASILNLDIWRLNRKR